ncbi:MAG: hypothetical protein BMS9Abin12_2199 [Acidimicrobiia bacterium]|nr:MAG: hypothetical protein BMS9Abin12_2199 [Acidimicrobiia bacterium]
MPRPDKVINPGQLDGPTASTRSYSWSKYGGVETVDSHRGIPSTMEVTVDDITVIDHDDESGLKYSTRDTVAHGIGNPDFARPSPPVESVKKWVVDRSVEGRSYHRRDILVMVGLTD